MVLTPDLWRRVDRLLTTETSSIPGMLRAVDIDPSTALRNADLRGCDLRGENMAGFDLTGADLADTTLVGANVTKTIFAHANLAGVDLSNVTGLDQAIGLNEAQFDARTKWPCPDWADAAGRDSFGPWSSFTISDKEGKAVTQRLRWCPAGSFRMGSPKSEIGRFTTEDRSNLLTFAQGFWMFETPCTQALWMAVMGDKNPSRFKGLDRPVENVTFSSAHRFIQRLNRMKRGISLMLPSEAQWEYACRAGTMSATYADKVAIKETSWGKYVAGELDQIAWYYENSGGETHPVRMLKSNLWGFHDMLGNVWEWCADDWDPDHTGVPLDGSARRGGDKPTAPFLRGGSWFSDARFVRAAYRGFAGPLPRPGTYGFRCARSHLVNKVESQWKAGGPGKRASRATKGLTMVSRGVSAGSRE